MSFAGIVRTPTHRMYRIHAPPFPPYPGRYLYWESIIMLRQLCVAVVVVLLAHKGVAVQMLVVIAVVAGALVLQLCVQPFKTPVRVCAHVCVCVCGCAGGGGVIPARAEPNQSELAEHRQGRGGGIEGREGGGCSGAHLVPFRHEAAA